MNRWKAKSGTCYQNGGDQDINDRLDDCLLTNDEKVYVDPMHCCGNAAHPTRNTVKITYSVDALCQDLPQAQIASKKSIKER
jgi:hypothetical protein